MYCEYTFNAFTHNRVSIETIDMRANCFFYLQIKYLKVWVCTLNKYFPLIDFYFFIHNDCSVCLIKDKRKLTFKSRHLSRIYDNIYLFCFSNSVNMECIPYIFSSEKYIFFLIWSIFRSFSVFLRSIWWWIILNSNSIFIFFSHFYWLFLRIYLLMYLFSNRKVNFPKTWFFFELSRSWIEKESDLLISLEKRSIHCHFLCHEFIVLLKSHYIYIQHSNFESTWNHLINDLLVLLHIMCLLYVPLYQIVPFFVFLLVARLFLLFITIFLWHFS